MEEITRLILNHYPNATNGSETTEKYLTFLENEYNCDLKKVLFATSLCCDDINISTNFRKVLTRPFAMGGLGGLPFSGFTGMVAYGHHIPDGGDAFIFYGPHIGITDEGVLGKMRRPGQQHLTNSCGALMLALERLKATDEIYIPSSYEFDYQQTLLERTMMPFKQQILAAELPHKEITEVAYQCIDKQIHYLIKKAAEEFTCNRVFLLGGIILNTSPEFADYVDIRTFEMIDLKSLEPIQSESILTNEAFMNL